MTEEPTAGAVVTFAGVVRDHDGGRAVRGLEYTAHPTAAAVVAKVAAEVAARAPGVRALAVSHRVGVLDIGEVDVRVPARHLSPALRPPPAAIRARRACALGAH